MKITERKLRRIIRSFINESTYEDLERIKLDFKNYAANFCQDVINDRSMDLYHLLNDPHAEVDKNGIREVDLSYNIDRLQSFLEVLFDEYVNDSLVSSGGEYDHRLSRFLQDNVDLDLYKLNEEILKPLQTAMESRNCNTIGRAIADLIFTYMLNKEALSTL